MLLSSFVEHEVALEIAALFTSRETNHVIHLNMAAPSYRCDPCGKDFDYKSKYERHLESQVHKDKVYYIAYGQMTEEENYSYRTLLVHEADDDPLLLTSCESIPTSERVEDCSKFTTDGEDGENINSDADG